MNLALSLRAAATALAIISLSTPTFAADPWPSKPVKFVIPFPAGSAPDVLLRYLGTKLTDKWGHQVVIDNKPGGSGVIGMNTGLSAPTDGYTFIFSQGSAIAIVPKTIKGVSFDYPKDFTPVAMVATSPLVISVPADSPYKTLEDLVAAAKKSPGNIELADVGRATVPHLAAEMLGLNSGTKYLHVHFQGGPPAIQATMGGQTKAVFETLGPILGMVQGGKLRVLASMSDRVEPGLEKYPLATKTAPGTVAQGWFAVLAKKGVDAAIISKLNADINEALARPDVIAKFKEMAAYPRPGTAGDLDRFIVAEQKSWATLITRLGITPE
jgi:tripartite-type tricarboxylate transporter receptor subunit TctC